MFITPAYAQAAGGAGAGDLLTSIMPILLIIPIFYFLIIRPQQKRVKTHKAMLDAVARNDTIVTSGGIIGKVTKVNDNGELDVEIAKGVKIKLVQSMISEVRVKGEPAAAKK